MAKFEVMALRIDARTRDRLVELSERLGVPKTVLARSILKAQADAMWNLMNGQEPDDGDQ